MKLWMVCGWPETTMKRHSSVALVFSSISGGWSKSSCNRFFAKSSSSKKLGSPQEPQKRHMLEPLRTGSNFQDPPGQRAREEPWSLILFWRGLTKLVSSRYNFHTIFQSKNVTFGVRWTRLLCESLQVGVGGRRSPHRPKRGMLTHARKVRERFRSHSSDVDNDKRIQRRPHCFQRERQLIEEKTIRKEWKDRIRLEGIKQTKSIVSQGATTKNM